MRAFHTLALLSCLLLCGCLEIEQTITLKADGSGTQTVKMDLRDSLIKELRQRQPAAHLGEAGDPTAVFYEQKVRKELTAAGLELTAHKVEQKGGHRAVDLTASFADFDTLRKSPLCGSSAEWELSEGPKPGLAKLTLYPQGKIAWHQARVRAAKMKDQMDPVAEDFFRKRQAQLKGLDVVFRFQVPGKVLVWTKNMEKVSDREVLARVTAAQIKTPKDLVRRLAPRFEVIFDASGTRLFD